MKLSRKFVQAKRAKREKVRQKSISEFWDGVNGELYWQDTHEYRRRLDAAVKAENRLYEG